MTADATLSAASRPVRKELTVPLPPREAFALFTQRIGDWWPARHRDGTWRLERRPGGTLTERRPDGRVRRIARVRDWQEGARLELDWYPGREDDAPTRLTVLFLAEGDGCRVQLTHDGWTSLAAACACAGGWEGVLRALPRRIVAPALNGR